MTNGASTPEEKGTSAGKRRPAGPLVVAASVVALSLVLPVGGELTRQGLVSLGILVVAVVLWVTEVVNPNVTALAILGLLPALGALTYAETFEGFGNPMLWRLVGILTITIGLSKSGLDRRMAWHALKLARGNVYAMLLTMVVLAQILVFVIPVPQGRTSLLAATYLGILQGLNIRPPSNIGRIVFIGIPALTVITSASLITGASVEIYAVGLFSTLLGHNWSYVSWMTTNLPLTFGICFLMLGVLILLFPPERRRIDGSGEMAERELTKLGPVGAAEKKMVAVFAILSVMWFGGISELIPAELLMATVLFLPGIALLKWSDAQKDVPWGTLVLYGSSLALAMALQQNKVVDWVAHGVLAVIGRPEPVWAAVMIFVLGVLVRLGMTNMTGVVATLFPLTVALAPAIGINPVWLGMVCVISSGMAGFFPSQSVSSILTYGFGYYSTADMTRSGMVMALATLAALLAAALFYWPLVGMPVALP